MNVVSPQQPLHVVSGGAWAAWRKVTGEPNWLHGQSVNRKSFNQLGHRYNLGAASDISGWALAQTPFAPLDPYGSQSG